MMWAEDKKTGSLLYVKEVSASDAENGLFKAIDGDIDHVLHRLLQEKRKNTVASTTLDPVLHMSTLPNKRRQKFRT